MENLLSEVVVCLLKGALAKRCRAPKNAPAASRSKENDAVIVSSGREERAEEALEQPSQQTIKRLTAFAAELRDAVGDVDL
jgi:hypothetical protein